MSYPPVAESLYLVVFPARFRGSGILVIRCLVLPGFKYVCALSVVYSIDRTRYEKSVPVTVALTPYRWGRKSPVNCGCSSLILTHALA